MNIPQVFAHEYDLEALHLTTPRGHDFHMYITPRYRHHYEVQSYEAFSADLLSSVLRGAGLFVDIGAHYGFFSLLARAKRPDLEIIAVEPTPVTNAILARNAEQFGGGRLAVRQLAVSDKAGHATFNVSMASDNCGFYEHPAAGTLHSIDVETTTVDALLAGRTPCPLVIKIDTEGHELAVLNGMATTLERFSDVKLLIEFNPPTLRAAKLQPEALLQHLNRLGFDMYLLDENRRVFDRVKPTAEWVRQFGDGYGNLYCIRRDSAVSVCFVSHSSNLFGAERALLELVYDLVGDYGAVCTVVVPRQGPLVAALGKAGAACIVADYGQWCGPKDSWLSTDAARKQMVLNSIKSLQRDAMPLIRKFDPDIVWTQTIALPWGAMVAAQLGKPHVWYVTEFGEKDHGFAFLSPLSAITEDIVASSDLVYTSSKTVGDTLFPNAPSDRVRLLYGYIPPPEAKSGAAGFFSIPGAIKIGMFSSIQPSKGQEDIVRAVAQLTSRGRNIELVIAGFGFPNYHQYLTGLCRELGLESRVKLIGFLEDVYPTMREADIVVVCSRAEAFGRINIEAMLLGKPSIYPNTGGPTEYMVDGKTGLSYTPGNVDELVERLEVLIADPGRRAEMGHAGLAHAPAFFTKDRFSGEAYRSLLQLRKAGRKAAGMPKTIESAISEATAATAFASGRQISRNDPCPCGSGKRYKHCHGRLA
jgi:FkbM family methyltransferase